MANKSSSNRWLNRQRKDHYVKQAQDSGWRSRAVYKLEQIDQRDHLLKPGQVVVDLGAAPGGWCQYVAKRFKGQGRIVGLDRLAMDDMAGVEFIQGDFLESAVCDQLSELLGDQQIDLVLSDMAPNFSGILNADMARSYELAELALDFAVQHLRPGGGFLVKLFQGEGFEEFRALARSHFKRVALRKPDASRNESREVYLLAQDFKSA